ncbi:MAG: demethoxyubiquinone hydroxylase family protein [Chromatiaceae bacterium]|jgi:ubiquinone biosynthesis monooxygenase Coq7
MQQVLRTAARPGKDRSPVGKVAVPDCLWPALRSDHAGETGAVFIYRGVLSVTRDDAVLCFARHHLATEQSHLALMEDLVPPRRRSRLLPVWKLAGWMTGALPALFGPTAVFRTIQAVETFVDQHYRNQIEALGDQPRYRQLRALLEGCRLDEVAHREDAASRLPEARWIGRVWSRMVDQGSRLGVVLASRF